MDAFAVSFSLFGIIMMLIGINYNLGRIADALEDNPEEDEEE